MMKAGGLAQGLLFVSHELALSGSFFAIFVLLATSLLAAATGSSIGSLLAAMPIFFPVGTALGLDPSLVAGAILSGAIFGDNLAPVSDVTIISSLTQRYRDGRAVEVSKVVRSRLPYALVALALAVLFYGVMGHTTGVDTEGLSANPLGLVMLLAVAALIVVAIRTHDVLQAVTVGILVGLVVGLASGALTIEAVFSTTNGHIGGFFYKGVENVSPIILLCLTLFAYTHLIRRAGIPEAIEGAILRRLGHSPSERSFETILASTTLITTTLFASVTSASVALVGTLMAVSYTHLTLPTTERV